MAEERKQSREETTQDAITEIEDPNVERCGGQVPGEGQKRACESSHLKPGWHAGSGAKRLISMNLQRRLTPMTSHSKMHRQLHQRYSPDVPSRRRGDSHILY